MSPVGVYLAQGTLGHRAPILPHTGTWDSLARMLLPRYIYSCAWSYLPVRLFAKVAVLLDTSGCLATIQINQHAELQVCAVVVADHLCFYPFCHLVRLGLAEAVFDVLMSLRLHTCPVPEQLSCHASNSGLARRKVKVDDVEAGSFQGATF